MAGVDTADGGGLDAMMLDMKRTFDEVIEAHATPEKAQQILDNPFYQALSSSFAGTQEYMAMEKLGQLRALADADPDSWDLIVVDTPPSRSALDFLDAPQRLGSFLDGRFIRILSAPARVGGRAYLKVVSAAVGDGDRGAHQDPRRPGARRRADLRRRARHGLRRLPGARREDLPAAAGGRGRRSSSSPPPSRTRCARRRYFVERLSADGMPLAGLVLNRASAGAPRTCPASAQLAAAEDLEDAGGHALAAGLLRVHADRMRRREREQRADRPVHQRPSRRCRWSEVPARPQDVHDLDGLREIGAFLAKG